MKISPYEYGGRDEPENQPFDAERSDALISDKRDTAGHENSGEARQHVDSPVPMRRVSDDCAGAYRHRDENQTDKGCRPAAHHDKIITPLVQHGRVLSKSGRSRPSSFFDPSHGRR
jgi:hypothetical protein